MSACGYPSWSSRRKLRQGYWEALAKVRLLAAVGPHPRSPQWVCSLQLDLFLRFHSVTLDLNFILTHKTPELEENKRCVGLSGPGAHPQWTTQSPTLPAGGFSHLLTRWMLVGWPWASSWSTYSLFVLLGPCCALVGGGTLGRSDSRDRHFPGTQMHLHNSMLFISYEGSSFPSHSVHITSHLGRKNSAFFTEEDTEMK